MSDLLSYKCPNCGSPLHYGAESQLFECDFCDSRFTLEQVKNASVNEEKPFDWGNYNQNVSQEILEGMVSYVCRSCGAEIVADAVTAATSCPYCGNPVVISEQISGYIKPHYVIPFNFTNKDMGERVKAYCKGKPLLPNDFVTTHKIEEIKGMYVPFWLYDCHADGDMTFDATKVRRWSDARYNYTETSYYMVTADGEMSFQRIPVDGSLRMDNALMDSIEPFDYNGLQPFAPGYLSGFLADRFDENADQCLPRATKRVRNSVAEVFRDAVDEGFTTMTPSHSNIQLSNTSVAYALFPVYLLSSTYKGERYQFALNGQTGKMTGNLPISKAKSILFFLGTLLGVSGIITAISLLL